MKWDENLKEKFFPLFQSILDKYFVPHRCHSSSPFNCSSYVQLLGKCDRWNAFDFAVEWTVPYWQCPFFFYKAKPEDTLDLCRIMNDDLAKTVKKYPKRFVGLGTLPMQVQCIIK